MTRHIDEDLTNKQYPALKRQQEEMKMPSEIEEVAAAAWHATKDKADPEFADCIPSHRDRLITHATSVRDKGLSAEGASDFEQKVSEILSKPAKAAKAKEK